MRTKFAQIGWTALMVLALLVSSTGVALAFDSPGKPALGPNTITWTGQGTIGGAVQDVECDGNNTPYLLWIFTMDGGAVSGTPVLTINGTDTYTGTQSGNEWHIVTPYYDPKTLTAQVDFTVSDPGNGSWVLTISHGCPGKLDPSVTTEIHLDDETVPALPVDLPLGSVVHDSALVTGSGPTPTGNVQFFFYKNDSCTGDVVTNFDQLKAGHVALDDTGLAHPSDSEGPLEAGKYSFKAFYEGDDNYNPGWSGCEPLTIEKNDSKVTTEVHDPDHNDITGSWVYVGTAVHDSSSVTGDPTEPFTITGTVTYSLFGNSECTGDLVTEDLNGGTITNPQDEPVGTDSPDLLLPVGFYGYLVSYSGDDNYNPFTPDPTKDCEPFEIRKLPTDTVTHVHDPLHNDITGKSVAPGTPVHDNATVTADPPPATPITITGTVTYTLYGNSTCTGDPIIAPETVAVGTESTPVVLPMGSYGYLASYSGDDNYLKSDGVCEPFGIFNPPLTPGYWKNHMALNGTAGCGSLPNGTGCSKNGPFTKTFLPQYLGTYSVNTIQKAANVFVKMNCSNTGTNAQKDQNAIGCLAGHLLAAELNVANSSNSCIQPVIDTANTFLTNPPLTSVTYGAYTANSIHYIGPSGSYSFISLVQRNLAIAIKNDLDTYNNGGGCP